MTISISTTSGRTWAQSWIAASPLAALRSDANRRQHNAHVTYLIANLRGHGLIAKVTRSRLYRVTERDSHRPSAEPVP